MRVFPWRCSSNCATTPRRSHAKSGAPVPFFLPLELLSGVPAFFLPPLPLLLLAAEGLLALLILIALEEEGMLILALELALLLPAAPLPELGREDEAEDKPYKNIDYKNDSVSTLFRRDKLVNDLVNCELHSKNHLS